MATSSHPVPSDYANARSARSTTVEERTASVGSHAEIEYAALPVNRAYCIGLSPLGEKFKQKGSGRERL